MELPIKAVDESHGLSSMLEFAENARHVWNSEELGAIFRHQLESPLTQSMGDLSDDIAFQLASLGQPKDVKTLKELLHHPNPPIDLLILTKRFAKRCWFDADHPLPREITILLYYASIAVARARCGRWLTGLRTEAVSEGLQWCRAQAWVDEQTRKLLKEISGDAKQNADAGVPPTMPPIQK
jgi:hypothetical protein